MKPDKLDSARRYDTFFGPFYFEPYAIEVADRIDPSAVNAALELAAGTGRVTRHIRERISPTATLIASDIDMDMLTIARGKLPEAKIEWQQLDAQDLPFSGSSFDLVVCSFGYMFVPDRLKAFKEAHRVLQAGGQFIFTTWDRLENNGASLLSRQIAEEYLHTPLSASADIPTSMSDEDAIHALLSDAGFKAAMVSRVALFSTIATAKEAAEGFVDAGTAFNGMDDKKPEIKEKLERKLADKFGAAPMTAPISAFVCQGWKH